jgi:segregation and condensation protein B
MLTSQIESLLFVAARPLNVKRLCEATGATKDEVTAALDAIAAKHNAEGSGIRVLRNGNDVQMSTSPDNSRAVQDFLKDETTGELTKPSLETLTIIAYRGPVTKAELEQIRGVNCSLILRNLLMRGLVEAQGEPYEPQTTFRVTMDFLRFLGVSGVEELPDYDKLRSHENILRVLEMTVKPQGNASPEGDAASGNDASSAESEGGDDEEKETAASDVSAKKDGDVA